MRLEDKLDRIAERLLKIPIGVESEFSLMSGKTGIALYLAKLHQLSGSMEARQWVLELSEQLLKSLDHANLRLSDGLCGQIWALRQIEDCLDIDLGCESISGELVDSLKAHTEEIQESDQLDLLHGLLGMELCLSKPRGNFFSESLDHAYLKHANEDAKGIFWYESLGDKSVINLGLAHGQAAHLCYLSGRVKSDNCQFKSQFKDFIKLGIDFLESSRLDKQLSNFPSFVENEAAGPSRLAWCYGDLGIGIAYLSCAKALDDQSLFEKGIQILRKTTQRRNENQSGIQDLGFCHGSAGVSHIYDYLFRNTSVEQFRESSEHWLEYTLERLFEKENTYRAFRGSNEGWVESLGLLDGLAGIGLVILNKVFPNLSQWEEIFYLKPIRDGKNQTTPIDHSPPT